MKLFIRNLLLPPKAFLVAMYKDGERDERRIFLDEKTMLRWVELMRGGGYEIHGFIESIPIIVNDGGT